MKSHYKCPLQFRNVVVLSHSEVGGESLAILDQTDKCRGIGNTHVGEDPTILSVLSAKRKLSCNRVREVIEVNRRGTWTINASALPDARSR